MKEHGVHLEVEGVRYIEMHRGPAAYVLGQPPSRDRDLELEGGVNACLVECVYNRKSPKTPTCEVPSNGVVEISLLPVCTDDTSIETRSSYREDISTLHCALENGADLHVKECQKIRHYRARSTEERRRIRRRKKIFLLRALST